MREAAQKICGIYTITNQLDGKMYVGKSIDVHARMQAHRNRLRYQNHPNVYLQAAYNKHGADAFSYELLEEWDIDVIFSMENYWVNLLNTTNDKYGYNICPTSPTGRSKNSPETRAKISKNRKGKLATDESKKRMSDAHLGKSNPQRSRRVVYLETGEIFVSLNQLSIYLGKHYSVLQSLGKSTQNNVYKYLDPPLGCKSASAISVIHTKTGKIFNSLIDAALFVGMQAPTLSVQLRRNYECEFRYLNKTSDFVSKRTKRKVIHIETNVEYDSIREACRIHSVDENKIYQHLAKNTCKIFKYKDEV